MKTITMLFKEWKRYRLMRYPAQAFILLQLLVSFNLFAQSDGLPRGAYQMPYTRYEASASSIGGGATLLGPTFDQKKVESEASDQTCASLSTQNSFVRWNLTEAGQGLVLRFSMPDAAGGGGVSGSLALYIGGNFIQNISLSSRWAWQYFSPNPGDGTKDPTNSPSAGWTARMRFDEVRVKLPSSVTAGTEVKLQKTANDGITYIVDFIEMEPIPAAISQPANSLSVTAYGANPNDQADDMPAFISCLNDAKTQGKNIYIPSGRFLLGTQGGKWMLSQVNNLTVQGAGIWYTELYFSNPGPNSGGIETNGSGLHLKDFYMSTENTTRTAGYKGLTGGYGTNSTIERIWAEHFEVGAWIANWQSSTITDGLLITGCRFRNNYADGVNFSKGTSNSICEHTSFRNNGDDAMASWSSFDGPACVNNEFRYCTAENTWRAAGIGFFGGGGHRGHHLLIKDGVETGIRVNSDFSGPAFSTTLWMEIYETTVISCGTNANLWFNRYGAVDIFTRLYNLQNLRLRNVDIINSQKDGIMIYTVSPNYTITNLELINVTVNGTGKDGNVNNYTSGTYDDYAGYGLLVLPNVSGSMSTQNLVIQNAATAPIENESSSTFPINGLAPQVPVVTNASLPSGTVSASYSTTITATNNPASYGATGLPPGLTVNTSTGVISGTPTASGTFPVTLSATNGAGTGNKQLNLVINPAAVQAPFGGTARNIPGTIQAEDFDNGGEGVAYHDLDAANNGGQYRSEGVDMESCSEGGFNIGWLRNTEWVEYTVNVTTAGTYTLQARVATTLAGRSFHVELNGVNISGPVSVPNTGGWQNWQTVTVTTPSLSTGQKIMRIVMDADDFNINHLTFTATGGSAPVITNTSLPSGTVNTAYNAAITATNSPMSYGATGLPAGLSVNTSSGVISGTPTATGTFAVTLSATNAAGIGTKQLNIVINASASQTPYGGSARSIPGTIQAEDFDNGGEGIAYHDTDTGNTGGQYRNENVDIESCSEGGFNVGWLRNTEWLEYTVNITTAGTYTLNARIASGLSGRTFHVELDGTNISGAVSVPNTGGWQSWQTVSVTTPSLTTGQKVLRIVIDSDDLNINYVSFTSGGGSGGGTTYRIKNRWQNTYLYDGGDRVRYSATPSGTAYNWVIEDVGGGLSELKNESTGEYMHIENLQGYVQCTARTPGWASSRWATEDAGSGFVRFRNAWQSNQYMHIENLQGHVQYGTINSQWLSAQWVLEPVSEARTSSNKNKTREAMALQEKPADEESVEKKVSYWPNAVTDVLHITSDGTFDRVEITDFLGRLYTSESIFGKKEIALDVRNLTEGLHLVRMSARDKSYVFRIIRKN